MAANSWVATWLRRTLKTQRRQRQSEGMSEWRRRAGSIGIAADDADLLRWLQARGAGRHALQHVHTERLPDRAQEHNLVPVRHLVRRRENALCRRRGQRHGNV